MRPISEWGEKTCGRGIGIAIAIVTMPILLPLGVGLGIWWDRVTQEKGGGWMYYLKQLLKVIGGVAVAYAVIYGIMLGVGKLLASSTGLSHIAP